MVSGGSGTHKSSNASLARSYFFILDRSVAPAFFSSAFKRDIFIPLIPPKPLRPMKDLPVESLPLFGSSTSATSFAALVVAFLTTFFFTGIFFFAGVFFAGVFFAIAPTVALVRRGQRQPYVPALRSGDGRLAVLLAPLPNAKGSSLALRSDLTICIFVFIV